MFQEGTKVVFKERTEPLIFKVCALDKEQGYYLAQIQRRGEMMYAQADEIELWHPCCNFQTLGHCNKGGQELLLKANQAYKWWQDTNSALKISSGQVTQAEAYVAWQTFKHFQDEIWYHLGEE